MKKYPTLYLFRHGLTYFSKNHIPYGDQEETAQILPEGIPVIEKVGNYLKGVDAHSFMTSPLLRCIQTSTIIGKIIGKTATPNPLCIEYISESFDDLRARMVRLSENIREVEGPLLICTHGAVLSGLKHTLVNGEFNEEDLLDYPKSGVILKIEDNKLTTIDLTIN